MKQIDIGHGRIPVVEIFGRRGAVLIDRLGRIVNGHIVVVGWMPYRHNDDLFLAWNPMLSDEEVRELLALIRLAGDLPESNHNA